MKRGFLLFIILLCVPFALSTETKLFEGWVTSGVYFNATNLTFRAIQMVDENVTVFNLPGGLTTVIYMRNTTCVTEWIYKICESKQKYEVRGFPVPTTVHDPNINISLYLKIIKINNSLDFKKTSSDKDFYVDIPFSVRINLTAVGDQEISNISFVDQFPPSFMVKDVTLCKLDRQTVTWEGNLTSSGIICTYTVIPTREGNYSVNASAAFTALGKIQLKSQYARYNVLDMPIQLNLTYGKVSKPGLIMRINITAMAMRNVTIDRMEFSLPPGIKAVNYSPVFQGEGNKIFFEDIYMKKNNKTSYFISAVSEREGNLALNATITYTDNDITKKIERTYQVEYMGYFFNVSLYDKNNMTYLRIANPFDFPFTDIRISIGNDTFADKELGRRTFKDFPVILDPAAKNILITYKTQYGQYLEKEIGLNKSLYMQIESSNISFRAKTVPTKSQSASKPPMNAYRIPMIAVGVAIALLIFLYALKKTIKPKSKLDQEIEELQKQEK